MRLVAISALFLLMLGGCPTPEADTGSGQAAPPPPSPFPAGVYSNSQAISAETTIIVNAELFDSVTTQANDSSFVIDENGRVEVEGVLIGPNVRRSVEAGDVSIEKAFSDVTVSGDVILIKYDATMVILGEEFTGSGFMTLKLRGDGDIDYSESMTTAATIDGDFWTAHYRWTGVMNRL